jgi:hypothetical protein
VRRGDVFRLRLGRCRGHEQAGVRDGVVVRSDALLRLSTLLIAPTPTPTAARGASFRPEIEVDGTPHACSSSRPARSTSADSATVAATSRPRNGGGSTSPSRRSGTCSNPYPQVAPSGGRCGGWERFPIHLPRRTRSRETGSVGSAALLRHTSVSSATRRTQSPDGREPPTTIVESPRMRGPAAPRRVEVERSASTWAVAGPTYSRRDPRGRHVCARCRPSTGGTHRSGEVSPVASTVGAWEGRDRRRGRGRRGPPGGALRRQHLASDCGRSGRPVRSRGPARGARTPCVLHGSGVTPGSRWS